MAPSRLVLGPTTIRSTARDTSGASGGGPSVQATPNRYRVELEVVELPVSADAGTSLENCTAPARSRGDTAPRTMDERLRRHYERNDEAARLWGTARGELARLRTWDIFERFLPSSGRIADIGGGPGTHAAHLAERGYEVVLVDPDQRHIDQATRTGTKAGFSCHLGDARALALPDASFDAALLLGPLYHLVDAADRQRALREALRVLRPGGRLLAEVITRHTWIIDATSQGLLSGQDIWGTFDLNLRTGLSNDPAEVPEEVFWAYFHLPPGRRSRTRGRPGRLQPGTSRRRGGIRLAVGQPRGAARGTRAAVAGDPADRVRGVMLGVSAHVIAVASKPIPSRLDAH